MCSFYGFADKVGINLIEQIKETLVYHRVHQSPPIKDLAVYMYILDQLLNSMCQVSVLCYLLLTYVAYNYVNISKTSLYIKDHLIKTQSDVLISETEKGESSIHSFGHYFRTGTQTDVIYVVKVRYIFPRWHSCLQKCSKQKHVE